MFVYLVNQVWQERGVLMFGEGKVLEVFASMGDADTFVWRMEQKALSHWAVKNNMGTFHYFVVEMEVNPVGIYDGEGL